MRRKPVIVFIRGVLEPFAYVISFWARKVGKPDPEGRSLYSAISIPELKRRLFSKSAHK